MSDVLVEIRDEIAHLTLNRPQKYNAFDVPFIKSIRERFHEASRNTNVRGVLLTGAGKAFCAGGDVASMRDALAKDPGGLFLALTEHLHPLIGEIRACPIPVVAALNGPVAGGGFGLALACDRRIASETASFKPAYSKLGIVPDGGLTYLLPRLVGFGHAQRVILDDATVKAEEAVHLGLVDRVVAATELLETAHREALRLAMQPAESFRLTKELLNASLHADLKAQLDAERARNAQSAQGPWLHEGIAAFFEKREPDFRRVIARPS